MLRAPVSAANSLLRSSDSAALPGNATVRRLSPCKNPPRSPPNTPPCTGWLFRRDAGASLRWDVVVGEVLEKGERREHFPLLLFIWGRDSFLLLLLIW